MSDEACPAGGLHDWTIENSAVSPPVYLVCVKCGQMAGVGEVP